MTIDDIENHKFEFVSNVKDLHLKKHERTSTRLLELLKTGDIKKDILPEYKKRFVHRVAAAYEFGEVVDGKFIINENGKEYLKTIA